MENDQEKPTVSSPTSTALLCVPSLGHFAYDRSIKKYCDIFYRLPRIIECFIQRANKELGGDYFVRPWTINRAVTLFKGDKPVKVIDYDFIENDIVFALDMAILEMNT